MNLRQLRYFTVLAEELHFGRAAERLSITQSPLTLAIQKLEREVGGQLFHRTPRRVELTQAGAAFLTDAQAILEKVRGSLEAARELVSGESGRLRLALTPEIALLAFVATTIRSFRNSHPDVRLSFHELSPTEELSTLQTRAVDVAIGRTPDASLPAGLEFTGLLAERLAVAMHREHPLAGRSDLRIGDLRDEPFVFYPRPPGTGIHAHILQLCAKRSFTPRIVQETREVATLIALTVAGLGIAIVPAGLARLAIPDLLFKPLVDQDAQIDIGMTCRADEADPCVTSFRRIATGSCQVPAPACRNKISI
ncbi:MAG: bacterial regulatory helix-turn-helix, lysR family protein [Gammaproteobacteria bacterium]|nr:bacterial regulatory helix-turn-helix, lysR family protein [Gammaproteobacteria bacterium]